MCGLLTAFVAIYEAVLAVKQAGRLNVVSHESLVIAAWLVAGDAKDGPAKGLTAVCPPASCTGNVRKPQPIRHSHVFNL